MHAQKIAIDIKVKKGTRKEKKVSEDGEFPLLHGNVVWPKIPHTFCEDKRKHKRKQRTRAHIFMY